MSREELRIGIIGAGGIARQRHLPQLAAIAGVRVVVVSNRSRESGERVAGEFGIPEVAEDWTQLVRRKDIDAVFICTWPYRHQEMSVAALEEGKHVFCQARMAMDLAEAKMMQQASRRHPDLVHMICPPPHRIPHEGVIRDLLSSDQMGKITSVEVVSLTGSNTARDHVSWREDRALSGLQALALGIYAEVINAWLGPYRRLFAEISIPVAEKREEGGRTRRILIPQVVSVTGQLASGALVTEHHSGLVTRGDAPDNRITVWGLNGTMRYRFGVPDKEVLYAPAGENLEIWAAPKEDLRPWRAERDFIDAIRASRQGRAWSVSPDFDEGLLYMRKVQAVYESARTGKAVDPAVL